MTETKPKYNWGELAEKGNNYDEIRKALIVLETHCIGLTKAEIYSENNTFKKEFKQDLDTKLDQIFEESPLPETDNSSMRKDFLKNLKTTLELIVIKKAYAQITFSQFHLHKFLDALNSFVDEIQIQLNEEGMIIVTTDPSRIGLMEIIFGNKSYQFYKTGKIGINLENFQKKIKCNNDNSEVQLIFSEQLLEMNITTPKRKRVIKRTLFPIDFEPQGNSIGSLHNLVPPYSFEMTKNDYEDLIKNMGFYSEIVNIDINLQRVIFSESGDEGNSEIEYEKKDLVNLKFNEKELLSEIEREQDKIKKQTLTKKLKEKDCTGSYSLSFLKVVKNFCSVLDLQDKIAFSIKTDTPLRVNMSFKKLNKTLLTFYLAPRVPEEEFEEDDDDFEPTDEEEEIEDDFEPTLDEEGVNQTKEE